MANYDETKEEKRKRELNLWKELLHSFADGQSGFSIPVEGTPFIIEVLNVIGKHKSDNHMFLPSGGGIDLMGAKESNESGLIELNLNGSAEIVNPSSLTINLVGDNPDWWYIRLDTKPFEPTNLYPEREIDPNSNRAMRNSFESELVLEVKKGEYMDSSYFEMNSLGVDEDGNEIPLPQSARLVLRWTKGGSFVVFSKHSLYNRVSNTYDALHNTKTDEEFKKYIQAISDRMNE